MSLKDFLKELNGSKVEGEILKTIFISIVSSFILFAVVYYFRLRNIEGFLSNNGLYLFLAVVSYSLLMPGIRQVRAFKKFPCMTGMMIGMTFGMISGFISGFFVAATNGMFWGSVFGMATGIFIGVWNGKCCGVMGIIEGLMAGFMGGLMGAMTAVMMINDNLKAAGIIIFLICGAILVCLNYLLYIETKNSERISDEDNYITIFLSFLLTALTLWFMAFGPRSALFGG